MLRRVMAEDQRQQTNNARLYKDGFHSRSRWQVWANKPDHVKHKPLLEEQTRTPLKVCQHIGSEHARAPLTRKKCFQEIGIKQKCRSNPVGKKNSE